MGLNLEASISLNAASFQRGMTGVTNSVMNTVKAYALGAVGVLAFEKAFSKTLETVKELVNESKRMGVTIEQLQVMRKAASGAGVEMALLAGAMEKLNVARAKALGGGPAGAKAQASFSALGVTSQMLQTMPAQDIIFKAIHDKIKEVNPQTIAAPLRDVLGRGFGPLIPLIGKDMDALRVKMESLGMIISGQTAYELKAFDTAINSIKNILISRLAPALAAFGVGLMRFWEEHLNPKIEAATEAVAIAAESRGTSNPVMGMLYKFKDTMPEWLGGLSKDKFNEMYDPAAKVEEAAKKQGSEMMAAWLKEINEQSQPKAITNFGPMVDADGNKHHTAGDLKSDSMVSAGNFLGALRSEIPDYEKQKIGLLQRIATAVERPQSSSSGDDYPD